MKTYILIFAFFSVFCQNIPAQNDTRSFVVKDTFLIEEPTEFLKLFISEVSKEFLYETEKIDTNEVVVYYEAKFMEEAGKISLHSYQKNKIAFKVDAWNSERFNLFTVEMFFTEEVILEEYHKTIPTLIIKKTEGISTKYLEVKVYGENYWIATENTFYVSCSEVIGNKISKYENGEWTVIEPAKGIEENRMQLTIKPQ